MNKGINTSKNDFSLHKYLVKNLSKFGSLPPFLQKEKKNLSKFETKWSINTPASLYHLDLQTTLDE